MHYRFLITLCACLLLHHAVFSQPLEKMPERVITRGEASIRTTLYAEATHELLVFEGSRYWTFTLDGQLTGGPFTIGFRGTDILYPRISETGQSIFYFIRGRSLFGTDNSLAVFSRTTNNLLGVDSLPYPSEFQRAVFFGDSILQHYSSFRQYRNVTSWFMGEHKKRKLPLSQEEWANGWFDVTYYKDRQAGIFRNGDTLSLVTAGQPGSEPYVTNVQLADTNSNVYAQLSNGYPYALFSEPGIPGTKIYRMKDSSFVPLKSWNKKPFIYGGVGSGDQCFILFDDSTSQPGHLQIYNAFTGTTYPLAPVPGPITGYRFDLHPREDLVTASHLTSGAIIAFRLSDGNIAWKQTPAIQSFRTTNTNSDSADNRLFKVLIKQGSDDVTRSYFDKIKNQLLLIRNNDKLVTVDATAKAAIRWEQFYRDAFRVNNVELLPGNRYILFTEEAWLEDPDASSRPDEVENATNDRGQRNYPYGLFVYDRQQQKTILTIRSAEETRTGIINDSLIYWSSSSYLQPGDSVSLYNLNTGTTQILRPVRDQDINRYQLIMANGKLYWIVGMENELKVLGENGRALFTRKFEDDHFFDNIGLVPQSSYFYVNDNRQLKGNAIYQVRNDSIVPVRALPASVSLVSSTATISGCWIVYRKQLKRKNEDMVQYHFMDVLTGRNKILDSVAFGHETWQQVTLYPEDHFYTVSEGKTISWRDLENNFEFNNFGRDEPTIISIAYSPDGRYLAAANPQQQVMLWDLGTGKETKTLTAGQNGYITRLAFSGDGKYLAASSGDIWEVASGKNVVSVTDRSIWQVNSIDFSNDGQRIISGGACIISWDAKDGSKLYFQQRPRAEDMDSSGTCWSPQGCVPLSFPRMVQSTAFHPNSRDFVTGNASGIVQRWNTESGKQMAYGFVGDINEMSDANVYGLQYTRDGKSIIAFQRNALYRLDATTLVVLDSVLMKDGEEMLGVDMGYEDRWFGCIIRRYKERVVQLRRLSDMKVEREFRADGASFNKITFSPNRKQVATASDDGFCTIWDLASGKPVMYLSRIGEYGNIMVTPDNYYMASRSALDGVTFLKDSSFYSFDQFDLYLNRPDIVLSRLGYATPELINFYRMAYFKRLKKATGQTREIAITDYVPSLQLKNRTAIASITERATAFLSFAISDTASVKGTLQVYINGNPVWQHALEGRSQEMFTGDSVVLAQGVNNIEAIYRSQSGVESRKEKITITYSPRQRLSSKVWFIGIGVSNYRDAAMNLRYPVKDIRDIARDFKKHYPGIIIDTLLNENATRSNIIALHDKLMKTGVNDKVIVSFSGHGLLSDSLDWYFATWDMDFKKPELNGLGYGMMESLLDGIPARQKLLLMDACHSGEVDKESDRTAVNQLTGLQPKVVPGAKGLIVEGANKTGLQTSFELMQELFANLSNGNGTTVLSAAGGNEYALESDTWKNGVFTYSLLQSLKDKGTDTDKNGKISVKELKRAVFEKVVQLTGGRQKPTSRIDQFDDWTIW